MTRRGIKLATIFGIEITIDYSWFIVFFLVTWSLSFGYFPAIYGQIDKATNIVLGLITSILFFASALIHELSHSLVARVQGSQIKKITLFIFGGAAHLTDEPKTAGAEFKMAIAGPLSSLALSVVFSLLYYLLVANNFIIILAPVLQTLAFLNFMLGFFNLLPGFPLDGGRVLRSIIWALTHSLRRATYYASLGGKFIASSLVVLGIIEALALGNLGGIWLILIGSFLYQAAEISYRQMILRDLLSNIQVGDMVIEEKIFISSDLKLQDLSDIFLRYRKGSFLVKDDDKIVGIVNLDQIKGLKSEDLKTLKVKDVMTKTNGSIIDLHDSILKAFEIMSENKLAKLPVYKENKYVGVVNLNDIYQYLRIKSALLGRRRNL